MDESELEGLNPFDLLDAESERVARHFASTDEWDGPSRCEGWTVRDMLSHLAGVEMYNRACLDGRGQAVVSELAEQGASDVDAFNDWFVRLFRDRPRDEVLAQWKEANASYRAEMRDRGREGSVDTSIGPYPVWLQAFHLATEYATHGDDIGAPVEPEEREARVRWRARFARFAIAELGRPVQIQARAGRNQVSSGGETAELSDEDLVEASQARLPADHPLSPALREALKTVP
jgi:uncharacterized protein (TIGR03083 family)